MERAQGLTRCNHTHTKTTSYNPGASTHSYASCKEAPKLGQLLGDAGELIGPEVPCDGDVVKPIVLTEIAEDRFRGLHNIQQHLLELVALQGVEGDVRLVVSERAIGGSHYVHLQTHLVSHLIGGGGGTINRHGLHQSQHTQY